MSQYQPCQQAVSAYQIGASVESATGGTRADKAPRLQGSKEGSASAQQVDVQVTEPRRNHVVENSKQCEPDIKPQTRFGRQQARKATNVCKAVATLSNILSQK